jgi:hypothetical protein
MLVLNGRELTEVSTYGAATMRAAIELHLARDPVNEVVVIEPAHSACFEHMSDLMGPSAQQRWSWAGTRSSVARTRDALIPAMPIRDAAERKLILDEWLPFVGSALHYDLRARRLVQEAAGVFLDNVDEHRASRAIPPVIAAAHHPESHELQLVCINLDEPDALVIANLADLRQAVNTARHGRGGLNGLVAVSHAETSFAVRLMAGTGRGRRTRGRSWDWREVPESFSGFVAGLEVHD